MTLLPLSRVGLGGPESTPISSGVGRRVEFSALGISSTWFGSVFEVIPVPTLVVDESRHIVVANRTARALWNAVDASFVGHSLNRYLSEENFTRARLCFIEKRATYSYDEQLSRGGVEVSVTISLERLEVEAREFWALTIQDRTAEQRARAELLALEREASFEAVNGVSLSRLQQAQHLEILGELSSTLAHDFNNLLSVILGSLTAARQRLDRGEDPRGELERAQLAAERSVRTTAEVLHYARRRELPPLGVNPLEVISDLRGLLERALDGRGELELDLRDTGRIAVPPVQLETALLNLVVNARDALRQEGRVILACGLREIWEEEASWCGILPGPYVSLTVTDNGIGMSAEVQAQAFEPFFTTKSEGSGTGLGLSTVQGLAQRSGGAVTLRSIEGAGTVVEILFPPA